MTQEFVTYEQALKLKELGFDETCFGYYVDGELRGINLGLEELGGVEPYYKRFGFHTICNSDITNMKKTVVTAPTFSQSFRFFREKYGLDFYSYRVLPFIDENDPYPKQVWVGKINTQFVNTDNGLAINHFHSYEEGELACLNNLIEIVESYTKEK